MDNGNSNEAGSSLGREVSSEKCLGVEKSKDLKKKKRRGRHIKLNVLLTESLNYSPLVAEKTTKKMIES